MKNLLKRFKVFGERVRGIRQAAVRESIARQQIAKFVLNSRLRNGKQRQQCGAAQQRKHANKNDGSPRAPGKVRKVLFQAGEALDELFQHLHQPQLLEFVDEGEIGLHTGDGFAALLNPASMHVA